MEDFRHISVLYHEVLHYLSPRPGGVYVDGTLGGAGHARGILESSSPDGILLGFDRDQEALAVAASRLSVYGDRVRLFHENYSCLPDVLAQEGIESIDGMVLDVGVSSHQLDKAERGFSFQQDALLDMRMDGSSGRTAADLVNTLSEKELEQILWDFGEERWARRIAAVIVAARNVEPITTTTRLVDLVKGAIPRARWEARLHPATRTFQAIRIAVNEELKSLELGLVAGIESLKKGGRIAVISFHSLEDRIVKNVFNEFARGCICPKSVPRCVCGKQPVLRKLTGKPVVASQEEIDANPRSRSAKLRAAEKL
ncbi:MAG: 16S rRNA (cytosine(1402)-N(4))-methyltransferase RsmH [Deltaproteobacteria bacterium]|nr:16S rRNA (cytosine(1402)-N(4))-methyltransferase RsmH [Deltaproteobacteria bacterium]